MSVTATALETDYVPIWGSLINFKEWLVVFDMGFNIGFMDMLFKRKVSMTMRMLVYVSRLFKPIDLSSTYLVNEGYFLEHGSEMEHVFREISSIDCFWHKLATYMNRDFDILYDIHKSFCNCINDSNYRPDASRSDAESKLAYSLSVNRKQQFAANFELNKQSIERLEMVAPYYDILMSIIRKENADKPLSEQAFMFLTEFRKMNKNEFPHMELTRSVEMTTVNKLVDFETHLLRSVFSYSVLPSSLIQIEGHANALVTLFMGKHTRLGKDSLLFNVEDILILMIWKMATNTKTPFYMDTDLQRFEKVNRF